MTYRHFPHDWKETADEDVAKCLRCGDVTVNGAQFATARDNCPRHPDYDRRKDRQLSGVSQSSKEGSEMTQTPKPDPRRPFSPFPGYDQADGAEPGILYGRDNPAFPVPIRSESPSGKCKIAIWTALAILSALVWGLAIYGAVELIGDWRTPAEQGEGR